MQCQLSVQTTNYSHQETQTWTITGPPKDEGAMQVYPGSWSVAGEGSRQDVQGVQTTRMQWSANVPSVAAPLVVLIRASDKQLIIKPYHSQLRSNAAVALTRRVAGPGAAQQPSQQTFAEYEWQFPWVQDSPASTRVSGSSSDDVTAGIGPMQPAGLPGKAMCKWSFSKGAAPSSSPQPTQQISALGSSLQPAAKAWVAQQARAVAQSSETDAVQIEAQVRASVVSPNGGAPEGFAGLDVDQLVALVLMEAEKDQEQDIRQLIEEMQKQRGNPKGDVDGLSSQRVARMQKATSQNSKLQQVLANVLEKVGDTASQISSNLK